MAKSRSEAVSAARLHALEAIETLIDVLRDPNAPTEVRNAAARSLIARGWIKAPTPSDDPTATRPFRLQ